MEKPPAHLDIATHPHDGLVKYAFSKRHHAKGLLRAILPATLTATMAWSTLRLKKDTFIDPALRNRFADLLFTVRIRGVEVHVYILLEHQRSVDKLMMLRLLIYMARIWERIARDDPRRATIPAIVPVLLHHSATGWRAEITFENIVDLPAAAREALLPHIPRFQARLVDLSPASATAIADEWLTAFGKLVLWALSVAGDDARFLAEIGRMQEAVARAHAAPDGYEALRAIFVYISATHQRLGKKQIVDELKAAVGKDREKVIMSLLDELRQEGELRGRQAGRAISLLDQLAVRFGSVPADAQVRIQAADEATLKRWSIRVLTESTLDAVLDRAPAKRARPARKAASASKQHTRS